VLHVVDMVARLVARLVDRAAAWRAGTFFAGKEARQVFRLNLPPRNMVNGAGVPNCTGGKEAVII
jgi:hypothetical protein